MTPLTQPQLLAAFTTFCTQHRDFSDFEIILPQTQTAQDLPGALETVAGSAEKAQAFEVICQNGAGSYVAFWRERGKPAEARPLVWLDSEGLPYGVFANSFADFLSLLPFGSGLIATTLWFCTGEHPRAHLLDIAQLTQELVPICVEEQELQYSKRADYISWLVQTTGLSLAEQPVAYIAQAYNAHAKVDDWLAE